jgi:hypothetical protein
MINKSDIELLNTLIFDPLLEPNFEVLKSCLIWPDEAPKPHLSFSGREFLYDLWIVRGFIHRSVSVKEWGLDPLYFMEAWNFGLCSIPEWPGFKRLILNDVHRSYLGNSLGIPLSAL